MSSHVYRNRTYTLQNTSPHFNQPPLHVKCESDLHTLFQPLITLLDLMTNPRKEDNNSAPDRRKKGTLVKRGNGRYQVVRMVCSYCTVHKYCEETDTLTTTYVPEPNQTCDEKLLALLSNRGVKLLCLPCECLCTY